MIRLTVDVQFNPEDVQVKSAGHTRWIRLGDGQAAVHLQTVDQADALIRAAEEIKRAILADPPPPALLGLLDEIEAAQPEPPDYGSDGDDYEY